MQKLDGRTLSDQRINALQQQINLSEIRPHLSAILVGDNPASKTYIRAKSRACARVGISFSDKLLPSTVSQSELEACIDELNDNKEIHAILVQQPLPDHIDVDAIVARVSPLKDVDGFHPIHLGNIMRESEGLVSCTPLGILNLCAAYDISFEKKHVVIVNRSLIVGKPLALLCVSKANNATVSICHSRTANLYEHTRSADILISGIGKPGFFTADHIKQDAVLIDVSINVVGVSSTGKSIIRGDFDASVSTKAKYLTPVPGGVGPMTIATLLENTVKCYEYNNAAS